MICSQYLADIEEHLGVTIQQVDKEMKVPVDEFDGKVVYGEKKGNTGGSRSGIGGNVASSNNLM